MKKARRKWTRAAALSLALLLAAGPAASASDALGTELYYATTPIAQGVDYTYRYLWSATYSDQRSEHYLEYTPNTVVQPAVSYGSYVVSKNTLNSMAKTLESQGKRVLGGINGDYYVLATGAPLGMVVTNGVLRSSSSYVYALGFDAAGKAFIGQPSLSITAKFRGNTFNIGGGLNKVRNTTDGYFLYSSDYYANTYHTSAGVDVVLTPSTAQLGQTVEGSSLVYTDKPIIGGRISCTVDQVLQSTGSINIPTGKLVLTINKQSNGGLVNQLAALQPGDTVDIDISSADSRWASAVTTIGGLYKMVTGGVVESGLETTQAPRTAVGIRPDGSTVFYTIDGRQSGYSVGASMTQVAQRLVELGCTEAICLDGGGSTTFGVTLPGEDSFGVVNKPSEGSQRAVTNALFLVANQAAPGPAQRLILSPSNAYVLPGTKLSFSAVGIDAIGQKVQTYDGSGLSFKDTGVGTGENGVFTIGKQVTGSFSVSANMGELAGAAQFITVSTLDSITVKNEATGAAVSSVNLKQGDKINLTASVASKYTSLLYSDESFTWSVTEGLGTIDQSGVFTAGTHGGSGSITVSAGGKTVTIPVGITGRVSTVENFEGSFDQITGSAAARVEQETAPDYVRYGSQSARVTYSTAGAGYASIEMPRQIQSGETYLSLWVYGDGSGNTITSSVRLEDGRTEDVTLGTLSFTGWKQMSTLLPSGAAGVQELKIQPTGTASSGKVWMDQMTTAGQNVPDSTPPTVNVQSAGNAISATLSDNADLEFQAEQVRVTYDGLPLDCTVTGNSVSAVLPESDGMGHRVTVTVTDASGNIGRGSVDIASAAGDKIPFTDVAGHWAKNYIGYLYEQGISNGITVGSELQFQPNKEITRGEFALMVANWLRLDLTEYSEVKLPFVDAASIPAWCLDGVKAMYALGIMQGSNESGRIYAYVDKSITRAEAMTMLGRIQPKGYATAELSFADAASVPAWAASYVKTLVAQGVVSGYSSSTIAPNASITRGEVAKVLYTMR